LWFFGSAVPTRRITIAGEANYVRGRINFVRGSKIAGEGEAARQKRSKLRPRREIKSVFTGGMREGSLAIAAVPTTATIATTISTPAATTTATATAVSAAAATRTAGAGASFVNLDTAAFEVGVVKGLNCSGRIGRLGHLDEAESARLTGEFVANDGCAFDLACLTE
jgi:hypothetical protein